MECGIRVLLQRGGIEDVGEDYDLDQFGGICPGVGDLIVDPGMPAGARWDDLTQRTILEVVARYFQPTTDAARRIPYIAIVVKERAMAEAERVLAGA